MGPIAVQITEKIKVHRTEVQGVLILEPRVFGDQRGFFFESYNQGTMAEIGILENFVQDNHSRSAKNVLRGLHYQLKQAQGKLVRAVAGEIFDVAVDLRRSSPTFGKWTSAILSAESKRMMWVPAGCAHGFLVLSDFAEVLYKATDFYAPEHERSIAYDDPDIGIEWPLREAPVLSGKDAKGLRFSEAPVYE
jgi:dTDP-4-dehydrorhamnose 3,5-epimerase